jgi:hypothetical protein
MLKITSSKKSNAKRNALIAFSLVAITLVAAIAVFVQTALQQSQDSRSDAAMRGYDPRYGRLPSNMGGGCIADVAKCSDGSFVNRDVSKNCQFKACPDGSMPSSRPSVGTPPGYTTPGSTMPVQPGTNTPGFRSGSPLPTSKATPTSIKLR